MILILFLIDALFLSPAKHHSDSFSVESCILIILQLLMMTCKSLMELRQYKLTKKADLSYFNQWNIIDLLSIFLITLVLILELIDVITMNN